MNIPTIDIWESDEGPKCIDRMNRYELIEAIKTLQLLLDHERRSKSIWIRIKEAVT